MNPATLPTDATIETLRRQAIASADAHTVAMCDAVLGAGLPTHIARARIYLASRIGETPDTFHVENDDEPVGEEDLGMSREDAFEFFHRAGGRGLGLRVVNDRTGEVIAQD